MLSNIYIKVIASQIGGFLANTYQRGLANAWFTAPYYMLRELLSAFCRSKNSNNGTQVIEQPSEHVFKIMLNNFTIMSTAGLIIDQLPAVDPSLLAGSRSAIIGSLHRVNFITPFIDMENLLNDFKNGFLRYYLIDANIRALQTLTQTTEVNQCLYTVAAMTAESELIILNKLLDMPASLLFSHAKNSIATVRYTHEDINRQNSTQPLARFTH